MKEINISKINISSIIDSVRKLIPYPITEGDFVVNVRLERILHSKISEPLDSIPLEEKKIPKQIEVNDEMFEDIAKAMYVKEQGYNKKCQEMKEIIKQKKL